MCKQYRITTLFVVQLIAVTYIFRKNDDVPIIKYQVIYQVMPKVIKTTPAFKKMNLEQRKCKLSHEVEENSIFKVYTQQNCKYECYVKEAESLCQCIPWDFMHQNEMAEECDIFGRTCFYNAMENISKSSNLCNDCVKECDYITYDGIVINVKDIAQEWSSPIEVTYDYFKRSYSCKGEKLNLSVLSTLILAENSNTTLIVDILF